MRPFLLTPPPAPVIQPAYRVQPPQQNQDGTFERPISGRAQSVADADDAVARANSVIAAARGGSLRSTLGEEQSTLQCRRQSYGERIGVDARS
jgi:hypothetical protein